MTNDLITVLNEVFFFFESYIFIALTCLIAIMVSLFIKRLITNEI